MAAAAPEDTRSEISDARRRLTELQARISAQEALVLSMHASMRTMARQVAKSRRSYEDIRLELGRTDSRIAEMEARYATIRERIQEAAADAYVRGRTFAYAALLDADSLSEAADVMSYANAIGRRNAELADQALTLSHELKKQRRRESALETQSRAALSRMTSEQRAVAVTFADSQVRLADLAAARVDLGALIDRLRTRVRAEELAAARAAAAAGTPLSFGRWGQLFLSHLHAPRARNNLVVMVAWQMAEYTTARWNPLATTYPMPGSTMFNSSRVRNYLSLQQGLEATQRTLTRTGYGYEAILTGLARNADPMSTAEAINESRWCRGCADGEYVIGLIDAVERYYDRYASKRA